MIIFVLIIVFSAVRTSCSLIEQLKREKFLSEIQSQQLRNLFLMLPLFIFPLKTGDFVFHCTLLLASVFLLILVKEALLLMRARQFVDNFCHFLDLIILQMRSGLGFRSSFSAVIRSMGEFEAQRWREILDFVLVRDSRPRISNLRLSDIISDLREVDNHPENALARLESLRYRETMLQEFRRKSRRATAQIRAQAAVLTVLYAGTLVFVKSHFGSQLRTQEIALSLVLFLGGLGAIHMIKGSFKWKI